jgi:hypothetical protein
MQRMIGIVSRMDGRISELASDTPTLDVPTDFVRPDGVVSLDSESVGHYIATDGKSRIYTACVRPLSWRARGEEFLVVQRSGRASARSRNLYRLVCLDPVS